MTSEEKDPRMDRDYLMSLTKEELVRRLRNYRREAIERAARANEIADRILSKPTFEKWKNPGP